LEELDSIRNGAAQADAVIHTAFNHDFTVPREVASAADAKVIEAMGQTLLGTDRPLLITSGTGRATEDDAATSLRAASEVMALSFAEKGVRPAVVRFPSTVHGRGDHGFLHILIDTARRHGLSAFVGDGSNRWSAVHRLDAARLFRVALESRIGGVRWHGVADEGVSTREIAEAIGRGLALPVRSIHPAAAAEHFGFLGTFFSMDLPSTSARTRERLGWKPVEASLIADLAEGHYFEPVTSTK
jgi:nucleoside-diphosphate-sugar epimerase